MTVVGNVQLYSENVDAADGANNDTPCHLHHNEREIANTSFSLRDLPNEILQHIFDFPYQWRRCFHWSTASGV